MLTYIRTCGAVAALFGALAFAQTGPAGHWDCTIQVNGRDIGLALDLAQDGKGGWIGSFGVPAQNASGLKIADLAVEGNSVKFKVPDIPRQPVFALKLGDGSLKGTLSTEAGELPVDFKRTGEAKVELPKASPAVSKQLEGDWEGTLKTPSNDLAIAVHLKNQPDKTVAATLDSPSQGAAGLLLENVKEEGANVEFVLKQAGAKFQGKLNKEGTELAGDLTQGGNSLPLTLRKK